MTKQLYTDWGKNLPEKCLLDYPRPQFKKTSYKNLNGLWSYAITNTLDKPTTFDGFIKVPFSPESVLSGVGHILLPTEFLHYKTVFTLPKTFNKGRIILHFGAIDQLSKIYINGVEVFYSQSGYIPIDIDISDYIKEKNEIYVLVTDTTDTSFYPRGKQTLNRGGMWYTPQSGIWQTVWLENVPTSYIKDIKTTPNFDEKSIKIVFNQVGQVGKKHIEIIDPDEKKVVIKAETLDDEITVLLESFKSWTPEVPFLYDLIITTATEKITSYVGMRKFGLGLDTNNHSCFTLNNQPYFNNGLLDQGYYPDGLLTPPSYEAMENDIKVVKNLGFNMLRKHIKLEPLMWYYYCDKHGIIVWQDMINGGENYKFSVVSALPFVNVHIKDNKYKRFGRQSKQGKELYYQELKSMVDTLYNFTSIAVYVPFNEGWGQFDSKVAYKLLKEIDPTRLVDHASGWHDQNEGDFKSLHIYFKKIKLPKDKRTKVITEFGGYSYPIDGHVFNLNKIYGYKTLKTKKALNEEYKKLFDTVIDCIPKGLSGSIYTQLTDVEDEINGILTYDRKVTKLDAKLVKQINAKLKY